MLFHKKKKAPTKQYDAEHYKPALKCSICNGEQIAGFKKRDSGKFEEVTFIRNEKELQEFMETYGITEPMEKIY